MKKNVAGQFTGAQMVSATDGSAFTGSVSVFVTIDNGSQAAGSGTVTHKGNGFHSYAPTQAETNGDRVAFTFTGTGAVSATAHHYTTFPQSTDGPTAIEIADAILARDIGSGVMAGTLDERTVRSALRFIRNYWNVSGTTLIVRKEDDSTVAWNGVVSPSPGADPISGMNPT